MSYLDNFIYGFSIPQISKEFDLLKIYEDQELPADIIPLVSSSTSGLVYLETASLDGEKNLKPKTSVG